MKDLDKSLAALRVEPGKSVKLRKLDSGSTRGVDDKQAARDELDKMTAELDSLQRKLYAEAARGLLIVFQATDTGGKDGVIRKVFGPLNPQGVGVSSFKQPSALELSHDYLWRIHSRAPAKGMIRIFNRSHYEDVLVRRVRALEPKKTIEARYRQINDFERYLAENGVTIVKFFLHISKDEQKERFEDRLRNPDKRWKFAMGDLAERKLWDKYREAYEIMLNRCSTREAPWYVIPADKKWYRDWAVAGIVLRTLGDMNPRYPEEEAGLDGVVVE